MREVLILAAITFAMPFAVFGVGVATYIAFGRRMLNGKRR